MDRLVTWYLTHWIDSYEHYRYGVGCSRTYSAIRAIKYELWIGNDGRGWKRNKRRKNAN